MKTSLSLSDRFRGIGLSLLAVTLFSSAYLVFANEMKDLAASTSFFWFSCFACLASWTLFRPKQKWTQSIRQGGYKWLITDILLYCCSFSCILIALKQRQTGVALTVIAINILRAPLTAMLGYFITRDSCQRWSAYWMGTILALLGLIFYRFEMLREWKRTSVDMVSLLSICSAILSSVDATVRKRYRNTFHIDPANAVRSTFSATVLLSFCWMMMDVSIHHVSPWPHGQEWMALIYLGIVPTAVANILFNKAEDLLSIPITQSINCLGPFFTLAIGLIPFHFFVMSHQHLVARHYIGLILTVTGAMIVTSFAGVKRRFPSPS